jgi:hypothetical protein
MTYSLSSHNAELLRLILASERYSGYGFDLRIVNGKPLFRSRFGTWEWQTFEHAADVVTADALGLVPVTA